VDTASKAPLDIAMRIQQVTAALEITAEPGRPSLDADVEASVQALWETELAQRGNALFNGKLFSIDKLGSDRIIGTFVEYRWFVAQHRRPALFKDLGVRPLAVSGMIESVDGLIFGKRNQSLATEGGKWELAPSGGLDIDACLHGCSVDYMAQFFQELEDEVGILPTQLSGAAPFVLIEDPATHVFDLGISAQTALSAAQIKLVFDQTAREYSELKFVEKSQLAIFQEQHGEAIVPLTITLLQYCKLPINTSSARGKTP
jgi:hypothetical protein